VYASKLQIKNTTYNDKEVFQQFYSGGPIRARPYASQIMSRYEDDDYAPKGATFKGTWITSAIEVAAANKIKAAIRTYIEKKKYLRNLERK